MHQILHIAAECYPAAKAGGLGDVVGALPKYLNQAGTDTAVILPRYRLKWMESQHWRTVWEGQVRLHQAFIPYQIHALEHSKRILGFQLYTVFVPGLLYRPGIYADGESGYGYGDETERYLVFGQAALQFAQCGLKLPKLIHCHDHHTGLIPWMMKFCPEFSRLSETPTVHTIHNGVYQGQFSMSKMHLLPWFHEAGRGYLEWSGAINPLAAAIRCAWRVTTVSEGYLSEIMEFAQGLEGLLRHEHQKCKGIINGIDAQVWNPKSDPMLHHRLEGDTDEDIAAYKAASKSILHHRFKIRPELPIITFIGRLVAEKGADLLPDAIGSFLYNSPQKAAFVILGTGDPSLMRRFQEMAQHGNGYFDCSMEYNETLSHNLYAGSDFLLMPSRVEPCGLNQMYSMRYGTIPIVRATGGLADTVPDLGDIGGRGFTFLRTDAQDAAMAMYRAVQFYQDPEDVAAVRKRIMSIDFSWETAVQPYLNIYGQLGIKI